jgi:hypothetical protein
VIEKLIIALDIPSHPVPELRALLQEVELISANPFRSQFLEANNKHAHIYDPEMVMISLPFFNDNKTLDMTPEKLMALQADGHIIVPIMPTAAPELTPIN